MMMAGGSSQSKSLESFPGVVIDLVRAAIVNQPLEHIQVTTLSCIKACPSILSPALAPEPLQYLQVTTLSCISACVFIPRAALQQRRVAIIRREVQDQLGSQPSVVTRFFLSAAKPDIFS